MLYKESCCSPKFCKNHRKTPAPSFFFNKIVALWRATLLKKTLRYTWFPVNFAKFLRTCIFRTEINGCVCNSAIMFLCVNTCSKKTIRDSTAMSMYIAFVCLLLLWTIYHSNLSFMWKCISWRHNDATILLTHYWNSQSLKH